MPSNIKLKYWLSVSVASSILLFSGCSSTGSIGDFFSKTSRGDINHADAIDPDLNLTRDDYKHIAAPKSGVTGPPKLQIEQGAPPVPKIADILAAPRPPKIGDSQVVSIAVTDDVPLKDVLIELAKLADVNIELDAGISGGITYIAKDRPFNEVIDNIANLANLRYTMKDGVLRVERDTPYIRSYTLDFLNVDRDSDSSVNVSTNVLSTSPGGGGGGGGSSSGGGGGGGGGSGGGGGGVTTGSTSSVKTKSTSDFWKGLEAGIQQILVYEEPQRVSENVLQAEANANAPAAPATGAVAPPTPAAPAAPVAAAASAGGAVTAANVKNLYTINRQAGVLTISATSRQHEMIQRYIDELRKNASSQVLIEAKIIEVDLQDQYASGINWTTVGTRLGSAIGGGSITESFPIIAPSNPVVAAGSNFVQFKASSNAANIIQLLSAFGTVRTLSSPRLHAINNQQATMTFATNTVYFTLTVTPASSTTTGNVTTTASVPTITSTINTVPIGIMMTMMPSIDLENNEVTLAVRPTLSTIAGFVNDPAFQLELAALTNSGNAGTIPAGLENQIPEVQVRELDSTLKLKSGQTMVIGGLMQQEATDTDSGIPFVSGLPFIGNAFKNVTKSSHNKELVLLIRATIVDTRGSLNGLDKGIFDKFSKDPRPVSF